MTVFYIVLILTYLLGVIITINTERYQLLRYIVLLVIVFIFVIVSGFRSNIGDTSSYKHSYHLLSQNPVINLEGKDIGFTVLQLVLINISTDPQILILVTSLITQTFNILTLYTYKNLYELQLYMYITSGYWLTSMNGIRQAMAASIVFISTRFLIKGNFLYYFLVIIIASSFHSSAMLMIPIYFIVREKPWSKRIWKLIILLIVSFVFYDVFESILYKLLEETFYSGYKDYEAGGSSFTRAVVSLIPVILSYYFREDIDRIWPQSRIFINMSLINSIILCFSMYNWIFARLTYYFQLYNFILLPFIISILPNFKERRILYYGFLLCYFFFMYYEQVIGGVGLGYRSVITLF